MKPKQRSVPDNKVLNFLNTFLPQLTEPQQLTLLLLGQVFVDQWNKPSPDEAEFKADN